jgi:hypothetical protein
MLRSSKLTIGSLLLAAACSAGSPATPPVGGTGPERPLGPNEQAATTMGMTIMSSDAAGAPRLMRAIVPRMPAAGLAPADAARDHVTALAPLWIKHAPAMTLADNGTQQLRNGATIVKLVQQVDGVVVHHGELRVMMHADSSLAAVSGTLRASAPKPSFASTAAQAADRALDQLYGARRARPAITATREHGGWTQLAVAADPGLHVRSLRARRELAEVNGTLGPTWAVEVAGDGAPDPMRDPSLITMAAHSYVVGDTTGEIVSDADLIQNDAYLYRVYAETTGNRRPLDSPLADFTPDPTGVPDGSAPGFISSNLVAIDSFNQRLDKWLPDGATTTSGNNAIAFSDLDDSGDFTDGDVRPNVTAGRILSFPYDVTAEALASQTQLKAGAVNSFFVVNWLHDWWYDSGFTEATGNGQLDNYGRGGISGDPLIVHAQDGANTGLRNNAETFTPADGASPEIFMFLWTSNPQFRLTGPAGPIASQGFVAAPHLFDLTGDLAVVVDATTPTNDGCEPITADLTGKIALVTFSGVCGSAATVANVAGAGAIGVVLVDGAFDVPRLFAGNAAADIPGLAIGNRDGGALGAALAAGPVTVTLHSVPAGPERDGDLDNTVVSHEWGHYLHHRLTTCDGSQQCSGMSEGWGDFDDLLMSLRDGDNRNGTFAHGQYANDNGTPNSAYFGGRRFPYSTDTTKNALRFRHIGDENPLPTTTPRGPHGSSSNSEIHNAGEVWAEMLWEAFNVVIDAHDLPTARRRMSDYIVAGMLLTPPEATFTEGRDAILAAASALDTDDMLLMAAAFAGRGAGSCAISPSNDSPTNAGVVESGTLAGKLEVSSLSLTDDSASCDHDGFLDPGETGILRVSIANVGGLTAEGVSVSATTTNLGVKLGAAVNVGDVDPFHTIDLQIPVTLAANAPVNTELTITVHVTGDGTCDKTGVSAALQTLTGVDELLATARVDHVETRTTPWIRTGVGAAGLWQIVSDPQRSQFWLGTNAGFPSDTALVSPVLLVSATDPFIFKFSHAFALEGSPEEFFDGGVIEASTNGGITWTDVSALGVNPGYTGTVSIGGDNPLEGRPAFSGVSPGFPARTTLTLNFGNRFAGKSVQLRFRIGTDDSTAFSGWSIDDFDVSGITNTPFPALVPETMACTNPTPGIAADSDVDNIAMIGTHAAPTKSLAAFDAGVCILNDMR